MTACVSEVDSADRYVAFWPKVHAVALEWLGSALPLELSLDQLVGYLTTQSNIEYRLQQGDSLSDIQDALQCQLAQIDISGRFEYRFGYEMVRFEGETGSV